MKNCLKIVLRNEKGALGSIGFAILAPVLLLSVGLMYDLGEQLVARAQTQVVIDATIYGVATFHQFEPTWNAVSGAGPNTIVERMLESQFKYNISINSIANSIDPETGYVCAEEANDTAFVVDEVDGLRRYRITCTFQRKNRFMNLFGLLPQ